LQLRRPYCLLGVLADHYDPDSACAELAARTAVHGDLRAADDPRAAGEPHAVGESQAAVEKLTDAIRAMPFRTRAEAVPDVLATALDAGETLLRNRRIRLRLPPHRAS
jgi:hypothetical protein